MTKKSNFDISDILEQISIDDLESAPRNEQESLRQWFTPSGMLSRILAKSARRAMRKKTKMALIYAALYGVVETFGIIAPIKLAKHLAREKKREQKNGTKKSTMS